MTDEETVEKWLDTLPDEFLECRDIRHAFGGAMYSWGLAHGFRGRVLVCARCGLRKNQVIDKGGKVAVSRSDYPTDYVKPGTVKRGRVSARQVRVVTGEVGQAKGPVPEVIKGIFDSITKGPSR